MAGQAYFISRFDTQCGLLEPTAEERFDLLAYLRQMLDDREELNLFVGCKAKLPCRVLAVRLPPEVVEERRRKAKANARCKGRTLSAEKLAWLAWSIYITNVPASMLTLRQVILTYTLRWQIELLFKLWKSEAQLDRVAGIRQERVLCEIYANCSWTLVSLTPPPLVPRSSESLHMPVTGHAQRIGASVKPQHVDR